MSVETKTPSLDDIKNSLQSSDTFLQKVGGLMKNELTQDEVNDLKNILTSKYGSMDELDGDWGTILNEIRKMKTVHAGVNGVHDRIKKTLNVVNNFEGVHEDHIRLLQEEADGYNKEIHELLIGFGFVASKIQNAKVRALTDTEQGKIDPLVTTGYGSPKNIELIYRSPREKAKLAMAHNDVYMIADSDKYTEDKEWNIVVLGDTDGKVDKEQGEYTRHCNILANPSPSVEKLYQIWDAVQFVQHRHRSVNPIDDQRVHDRIYGLMAKYEEGKKDGFTKNELSKTIAELATNINLTISALIHRLPEKIGTVKEKESLSAEKYQTSRFVQRLKKLMTQMPGIPEATKRLETSFDAVTNIADIVVGESDDDLDKWFEKTSKEQFRTIQDIIKQAPNASEGLLDEKTVDEIAAAGQTWEESGEGVNPLLLELMDQFQEAEQEKKKIYNPFGWENRTKISQNKSAYKKLQKGKIGIKMERDAMLHNDMESKSQVLNSQLDKKGVDYYKEQDKAAQNHMNNLLERIHSLKSIESGGEIPASPFGNDHVQLFDELEKVYEKNNGFKDINSEREYLTLKYETNFHEIGIGSDSEKREQFLTVQSIRNVAKNMMVRDMVTKKVTPKKLSPTEHIRTWMKKKSHKLINTGKFVVGKTMLVVVDTFKTLAFDPQLDWKVNAGRGALNAVAITGAFIIPWWFGVPALVGVWKGSKFIQEKFKDFNKVYKTGSSISSEAIESVKDISSEVLQEMTELQSQMDHKSKFQSGRYTTT